MTPKNLQIPILITIKSKKFITRRNVINLNRAFHVVGKVDKFEVLFLGNKVKR